MPTEHYEWKNEGSLPVRGADGTVRSTTLFIRYLVYTSDNGAAARLPIGFKQVLDDNSELETAGDDTFRSISTGEVFRLALHP